MIKNSTTDLVSVISWCSEGTGFGSTEFADVKNVHISHNQESKIDS